MITRVLDTSLLWLDRAKSRATKGIRHTIRQKDAKAWLSRYGLLERRSDIDYALDATQKYWRQHFGRHINPMWHIAIANVVGRADPRYIPHDIFYEVILPYFNTLTMRSVYIDKNLAKRLLSPEAEVTSVIKRMHGAYYTNDYVAVPRDEVTARLLDSNDSFIVKGSSTDNGSGIRLIEIQSGEITMDDRVIDLSHLEHLYGHDFAIQPRINQHPAMAAPHPHSVNTVRVITLRWRAELRVLHAFMRVGTHGKITDNAGTGGIHRRVEQDGRISPGAVDIKGRKYQVHPQTGFSFTADDSVPGYRAMCEYALELHRRIQHFDLVSWDFVVSENSTPLFLEMNFQGTSYLSQFAAEEPMFGELTSDILAALRS